MKRISFFRVLIGICICFAFTTWGQDPVYINFLKADGLRSNSIYDIRQDSKGFIWIATEKGLMRYDGDRFLFYSTSGNKSAAVSNILFVGNSPLVQNFKGQFFQKKWDYLHFNSNISKLGNFSLGHDFDGSTFAALIENGLIFYHPSTQKTKRIQLPKSVWLTSVNSTTDHFYITDKTWIIRVNKKGELHKEKIKIRLQSPLYHWVIGKSDHYFISKTDKYLIERKSGKKYDFSNLIGNSFVQNAQLLSGDRLALLTPAGIILFDLRSKKFTRLFSDFSCSKMLEDQEGNWWIGTLENGLLFIPEPETTHYLTDHSISTIRKIGDQLYLGSKSNAIFRFDIKTRSISQLYANSEKHYIKSVFYNPKNHDLLFSSSFFHFLPEKREKQTLAIAVNQITSLDKEHYVLSESNNLSIFPVNNSSPWISWKTKNRIINNRRLILFDGNRRFLDACYYQGEIVAQASDGIWLIGKTYNRKLKIGKGYSDILHIHQSETGVVITTTDQGIYLYRDKSLRKLSVLSKVIQKENPFKTKQIGSYFYLLTERGILVLDLKGDIVRHIGPSEGYITEEAVDFEIDKNTLYLATSKGLQIIPLRVASSKNSTFHKLVLNTVFVNGKKIGNLNRTVWNPDQNNFTFDLSHLHYKVLSEHSIFYRFNGKRAIPIFNNRLELSELAPGNYKIEIFARSGNAKLSSNVIQKEFIILAPFYLRPWFIVLVGGLIFGLGIVIFKIRIRQIQKKNAILQEKLNLEKRLHESTLASIKSQMNPHFVFNALNTIQSFIYTNEKHAASSYLVDFSELTRKILDMSNKTYVSLSEELEAIQLYLKLEKMRFEDDFTYTIDTKSLPHLAFQIPSMLIQPYLENAIKHGLLHKKGEKKLDVIFSLSGKSLVVKISDNGIGIQASQQINSSKTPNHRGFATAANEKRLEILNQLSDEQIGVELHEVHDKTGMTTGTIVELRIPINESENQ